MKKFPLSSTFLSAALFFAGAVAFSQQSLAAVTGFSLINPTTSTSTPMSNGQIISLATAGTTLSVQANTSGTIGSVVFRMDNGNYSHTESTAPYSLGGDGGTIGTFVPCANMNVGSHILAATAFSGTGGTGTNLGTTTISFTIVNSSTPPIVSFSLVGVMSGVGALVPNYNPMPTGLVSLATTGLAAGAGLSIQANSTGTIGSVVFSLDNGALTHTENNAPYSLGGDNGTVASFLACPNLTLGTHVLSATAFSGTNGTGTNLGTTSIGFSIVNRIVSVTTFGTVGQGGNDTSVFNTAISTTAAAKNGLEIPAGTYLVNPLTLVSNTAIQCDGGVTVGDFAAYPTFGVMWNAVGLSNIAITGPGGAANPSITSCVFQMPLSLAQSKSDGNEYRHCLEIESNNVTITGISGNLSGGDGLNIRSAANVFVANSAFDGVYRNGVSNTGKVNGLIMNYCQMNNTLRTGFDFEPNGTGDYLENITLNGNQTNGNAGGGLSVGPYALNSTSLPVSITINNHISNSNQGYGYFFTNNNDLTSSGGTNNPTGAVTINNSSSDNSQFGGAYGRKSDDGWQITFNNLTVTNPCRGGQDPHYAFQAAVGVGISGGSIGNPNSGGVHYNTTTISNADHYAMTNYFQMETPNSHVTFSSSGTGGSGCTGATNPNSPKTYP